MKLSGILAVIYALFPLSALQAQEIAPSSDSVKMQRIEVLRGNCEAPQSGCVSVSLSFPTLSGGNSTVSKKVNQTIYGELIKLLSLQIEPFALDSPGLKLAINQFIEEWELSKPENGEVLNWVVWADGQITWKTNSILVIRLSTRVLTDEFVPGDRICALNFNLKNGELIHLGSLVSDSLALNTLVQHKLRTTYPESAEALPGWPNPSSVPLPENYELRSTGIFLWFNEMEAPTGTHSPVSVFLTYEELDGIIRREKFF